MSVVIAGTAEAMVVERVLLDGRDVTRDCFYADDEQGLVKCYKRDDQDQYIITDRGSGEEFHVDYETLFGHVYIVRRR